MEQFVYADNAATTKLSPAVLEAMMPYLTEEYGNPSSLYRFGNHAKRAIEQARKEVADVLGAEPFEILFTGGGTEADNWIKEIMRSLKARGKNHFITSAVEHHALLHSAQRLQKEGFEVTFIPVDREGQIDPEQVRAAIRPETGLVSIMFGQQRDRHHLSHPRNRCHLPPGRGAVPHRRGAGCGPSAHQRQGDEHRPALAVGP